MFCIVPMPKSKVVAQYVSVSQIVMSFSSCYIMHPGLRLPSSMTLVLGTREGSQTSLSGQVNMINLCTALMSLHSFAHWDTTRAYTGARKVLPMKLFQKTDFQDAFTKLWESLGRLKSGCNNSEGEMWWPWWKHQFESKYRLLSVYLYLVRKYCFNISEMPTTRLVFGKPLI